MAQRTKDSAHPELHAIPTEYRDLAVSEWGLDFADVLQIREKLDLTPTERLKAAQQTVNAAIRIRVQNGYRG